MLLSHNLTMRGSEALLNSAQLLGDNVTGKWMEDGCTDRPTHRKIMLLSHNLTMMGSNVVFVRIPPRGLEGDSMTDSQTEGWRR